MEKIKVGIVGCGTISSIYIKVLTEVFEIIDVVACADIDIEKAKAKAEEFKIPKYCSVEQLLGDSEIKLVINLTIPSVHADVCMSILEAGKHVYVEKPFAVVLEDGLRVLNKAKEKGLLVGCAPDTFLGAGLQMCRKLIDEGWIGTPVAATAFMMGHGPEDWHPNPDFFYKAGGGPLFDMGPYYITAFISMLGPIKSVMGSATVSFKERIIGNQASRYGEKIKVEVPTHVAANLNFHSGAVATLITSFDVWGSEVPRIEIYGTDGTLSVPDPNGFYGPVCVLRKGTTEWKEIPPLYSYVDNTRGLGVADMAYALLSGRKHRASGQLGYHVLEAMHAIINSSSEGRTLDLVSTCEKPAPLPLGLLHGRLD